MKGALDELIASGEIQPTIAIMPDAPWSSRASYYVDSAYTGSRSGPHGRDGVHEGSDRARRLDVPDRGEPHGPRRRRLLDGRLRRDAVLARAPGPVRRGDRAQPGRVRPDPAERLQHARVRRVRARQEPLRRLDLQEAELSGRRSRRSRRRACRCRCSSPSATTSSRTRSRRTAIARPRLRGARPLQPGRARREPDRRAPRRRRRARLGRLGPDSSSRARSTSSSSSTRRRRPR